MLDVRRSKIGAIVVAVAAGSLLLAAAALAGPDWLFVDNPAIRAAAETPVVLAALAAGWIALLRAKRTRSRNDLALAAATGIAFITSAVEGVANVPLAIGLATIAVYLAGGLALVQRARRTSDGGLAWYAAAAVALAGSRVTFMLLPPSGSGWLSPGDLARLVVGAFLLMAIRAELAARRDRALDQAIAEERGRIAREIHDGMAQELAFIVSQSRRLIDRSPDSQELEPLAAAAQSALADVRRAIFNLKRPSTRSLSTAIVEQTFLIANRAGLALDVEVEGEAVVDPEIEHAILRIVNEAVSNAARHAGASAISIRISSEDDRVVVRVTDDGEGFDPRALRPRRGFGLRSMTQRAESLGGRLHLESKPGSGTMIEVAI